MTPDFFDRFSASPNPGPPPGLQLLFHGTLELDADALATALHAVPELAAARAELVRVADVPAAAELVSADGPPAAVLGLVEWGEHRVRLAGFDAPMPYGPVQACVGPALIAPPIKQDSTLHRSHALLYYTGTHADPLERYVALAVVASALARFDAIVVLNEEARTAVQALDLIPEEGEDLLQTLRNLPLPYLYAGFVKLDVGDPQRPWVRTFAAHRFGLPDLAYHLDSHAETSWAFRLLAGVLGYLRQSGEHFEPGDSLDLGGDSKMRLRAPTGLEWYLESEGTMLVIEPG